MRYKEKYAQLFHAAPKLLDAARQVAARLERLANLDKEAGYHPGAEANLEMAVILRTAITEATGSKT